jgi:hypothetical protein
MITIKQTTHTWITLAMGILLVTGSIATAAQTTKIRIGTYDSRFVALAFYRADNMKFVQNMMETTNAELKKARDAKDENKVKELEARGPAFQNLMHQQVFGNLSIPNVMTTIEAKLPDIARKAGVSMVVSKWEIEYKDSGIETVDVTSQLVDLFRIDENTRKMISDGMKSNQAPVPVDQLLNPNE